MSEKFLPCSPLAIKVSSLFLIKGMAPHPASFPWAGEISLGNSKVTVNPFTEVLALKLVGRAVIGIRLAGAACDG